MLSILWRRGVSGDTRKCAGETRGRPFQPGNPGKAKGTRHKTTMAMQALLDGEGERRGGG